MEVVVTTGAISPTKLQPKYQHQQTNTQIFYRLDDLPVAQPTVSKHWLLMIYYTQQNCKLYTWDTGIRGLTRGMATLPQGKSEPLVVRDKAGRPHV